MHAQSAKRSPPSGSRPASWPRSSTAGRSLSPGAASTAVTALAGGNASSGYGVCKRAGLDPLVAALGLTPSELGDNLDAGYKRSEPTDIRSQP